MFAGFTFSSRLYFVLFVMFCFRFDFVQPQELIPFSVVPGTVFCLLHVSGFGSGSQLFKVFYYFRSGTVLAPGARFESRLLLTVRDRFSFGSQFCKIVINGPGPFWLREPVLKKFVINDPGPFWLREPVFKEVCLLWLWEPDLKEVCCYRSEAVLTPGAGLKGECY